MEENEYLIVCSDHCHIGNNEEIKHNSVNSSV